MRQECAEISSRLYDRRFAWLKVVASRPKARTAHSVAVESDRGTKGCTERSPHLGWVAPAPRGTSPERLKATTLALAAARQGLDKLANEISKLEAQGGDVPRRRAGR